MVTQSTQNAKDIKFAVNYVAAMGVGVLPAFILVVIWFLPWLPRVVIVGRDIVDYCTHSTHAMTGSLC